MKLAACIARVRRHPVPRRLMMRLYRLCQRVTDYVRRRQADMETDAYEWAERHPEAGDDDKAEAP